MMQMHRMENNPLTAETYLYTSEVEHRLIECLVVGDYDGAILLLEEVFNSNFKRADSALLKMKCLFFDVVATIFKVVNDNENLVNTIRLEKTDLLAKIDSCESVDVIQDELADIFKRICEITKSGCSKNEERLPDSIMSFVQNSYNDHNLNVAFISGKFGVSANYVSTIFKKETGMALSEYISSVRIEHAKKLLKNSNMKASEISGVVGFVSFRTFSRVFRSIAGVSPGEYRKSDII